MLTSRSPGPLRACFRDFGAVSSSTSSSICPDEHWSIATGHAALSEHPFALWQTGGGEMGAPAPKDPGIAVRIVGGQILASRVRELVDDRIGGGARTSR